MTQVGRAPSLTLGAPTNSSCPAKLTLWGSAFRPGLKCPETSPGLGGVIGRYAPARGKVNPGTVGKKRVPWAPAQHTCPRSQSPLTGTPEHPPWASTCHLPPPLTRGAPADSTYVASPPFPASASFHGFSYLCYRLAPFSNSLKILCLGWEGGERKGAIPQQKRRKHTRLEKGTWTTSNFHSAEPTAEPVRQRGQSTEAGKSQAQGGGCRLCQPPLLSRSRRHLPPPPQ